jgi:putative DNA primase/helicase
MSEKDHERTYLAVPFGEKDEAKAMGARWDKAVKRWYIPSGSNPALFERWRAERARQRSAHTDPVAEFAEVLAAAGLILKGTPIMDGRIHRVPVDGDRAGQKSGAYAGHLDAFPGGYIENFKTGEKCNWKSAMPADALSAADRVRLLQETAARRAERESEFQAIHEETMRLLEAHLAASAPAPADHPYLVAKGVKPHGVLTDRTGPLEIAAGREDAQKWSAKGNLLIPLRDIDGQLVGVQSIDAQGRKFFPRGARLAGGMHLIGTLGGETIVIVEGYATGATIHEATRLPVVVASKPSPWRYATLIRMPASSSLGITTTISPANWVQTDGQNPMLAAWRRRKQQPRSAASHFSRPLGPTMPALIGTISPGHKARSLSQHNGKRAWRLRSAVSKPR